MPSLYMNEKPTPIVRDLRTPLNLSKNGRMIVKMPPSAVVYHGLAVSHIGLVQDWL
jgi:hypothetical protein